MEKETVLILLLLKPMTKTSQLNDIAIMIYNGGYPVLKIFFCHYFDENHMKDKKIIIKKIVLLLKPMTKTSQLNGKSREMFSDAFSVPNSFSRWRLEGVFSWTVSNC